ncbi:uncharacterized protein [Palaemon carinicauda]|uniref:uncharacterized protein n=1 Tax=Palaemon carinicauda TaxID=392227 RepID=UPI0035B59246
MEKAYERAPRQKLWRCVRETGVPEKYTWAIKKTEEKKLDVAEMRMLKWIYGVTRRDTIRNEVIGGTTRIRELSGMIQESRLRWYGHVMRRDEQYIGRRVMQMIYRERYGEGDQSEGGWIVSRMTFDQRD